MTKYIFKRLLYMLPVLLGIIIIVFTLMYITPGDPARSILGDSAPQEMVDELREEMGLNDSYFARLGTYLKNVAFHGDLGVSYKTGRPVLNEILARYSTTLTLTIASSVLAIVLGILMGIVSAVKQYSAVDNLITTIALFGVSVPSFWIAMLLVLLFSVTLSWLPATGSYGIQYWIMPVFTMGMQSAAIIMRMTRSSMLEVIRQDYIRTAQAKGQKKWKIITGHALKNAMIPIVTTAGIQICGLLAGSVLVESVFSLPGIGKYVVDSINYKDYPAVQGTVLFIGFNCVIINLAIDIIYCFIDPRIKIQYSRKKKVEVNG